MAKGGAGRGGGHLPLLERRRVGLDEGGYVDGVRDDGGEVLLAGRVGAEAGVGAGSRCEFGGGLVLVYDGDQVPPEVGAGEVPLEELLAAIFEVDVPDQGVHFVFRPFSFDHQPQGVFLSLGGVRNA